MTNMEIRIRMAKAAVSATILECRPYFIEHVASTIKEEDHQIAM